MTVVRILVSAGLLWFLAGRLDPVRADSVLRHADPRFLAAALVALLVVDLASAARWYLILASGRPKPALAHVTKLTFVGLFFNQLLPTGIGGDAVRAWRCRELGIHLGPAGRSVLLDRASGYLLMVLLYAAELPRILQLVRDPREQVGVVVVLGISLCGLLSLALADRLPARLMRVPILREIAETSREARRLIASGGRAAGVVGLSAITIGFMVLAYLLAGEGLGVSLSFGDWLLIVPPVSLLQLVPVSLAGWGVREAGMVALLSGFGIPPEAALSVSVVLGLCLVITGLPGGLIWLAGLNAPRPAARPAASARTAPPAQR